DEQIPAFAPFDMRGRIADRERRVRVLDERDAEVRHLDVLGTRELPARTARCAQRRREFIGAVRLDDDDIACRGELLDEIRGGRSGDRAADDGDISTSHGNWSRPSAGQPCTPAIAAYPPFFTLRTRSVGIAAITFAPATQSTK